jgi:glycosyltransferase involved in cell wall biosynthesis
VSEESAELRVTAVIALYNGRNHIVAAIQSILNQTVSVDEIVIVNDGSLDDSYQVVAEYLRTDARAQSLVRLLDQENRGQGAARNKGVSVAQSELIGYLDQDDMWEPTHVAEMRALFLNRPKLGWVYTDFNEFDENSRFIRRQFLAKQDYKPPVNSLFALISQDLMMLPSASLIRREAFLQVGGFDTQFRGYEDDDLFIRLFVAGWEFHYLPRGLVNYRIHPENSSRNLSFPTSRIKFYRKYLGFFAVDSDYYEKYLHQHLAPRMASAAIQDAAIASRDRNEPARKLASDFLGEIFTDSGFNLRSRLVFLMTKNPTTLRVALVLRGLARNPFRKIKKKY